MPQLPPGRRDGLIVEKLEEELLVYDSETSRAHSLNPVAAAVWELSDGERDAAEIAELVGVPENAVWRALSQLEERQLLDGELPRRMSGPEYSRRQAMRRVGLIGASAAFAAPLVKSIVVPTAAQAGASCVPENGVCATFDGEGCFNMTTQPCCPQPTGLQCIHTEGSSCLCLNPGA
jgi:coenzyme PQQ synthesis protein D (PqqD)